MLNENIVALWTHGDIVSGNGIIVPSLDDLSVVFAEEVLVIHNNRGSPRFVTRLRHKPRPVSCVRGGLPFRGRPEFGYSCVIVLEIVDLDIRVG